MAHDDNIESMQASNFEKVLADGPRLRSDYDTWFEARGDGKVLMGGLGSFGHGRMWRPEHLEATVYEDGSRTPADSESRHYSEAPYAPWTPDDFGRYGDDLIPAAEYQLIYAFTCPVPECCWRRTTEEAGEPRWEFFHHYNTEHLGRLHP